MATSTQRELVAEIERLGYAYEGHGKGNNEVILRHPVGGRIRVHATPSDSRYAKNKLSEARRRIRMAESVPGKFVSWMMQEHKVGSDERREITTSIPEEIERYLTLYPGAGTTSTLTQTFVNDPRVSDVHRKRGSQTASFILTGPDYAPDLEGAEKAIQTPLTTQQPNQLNAAMDVLRQMLTQEVESEVQELRTRNQLALEALSDAHSKINQALEMLQGDGDRIESR